MPALEPRPLTNLISTVVQSYILRDKGPGPDYVWFAAARSGLKDVNSKSDCILIGHA